MTKTQPQGEIMNDRKPLEFDGRFLWHPVPPGVPLEEQDDYLPLDVFRRLTGYLPKSNPRAKNMVRSYPSLENAMEALEAATAVSVGKCRVTRCHRPHCNCRHTQTDELYCLACAVKINRANPEVSGLIEIPRPSKDSQ